MHVQEAVNRAGCIHIAIPEQNLCLEKFRFPWKKAVSVSVDVGKTLKRRACLLSFLFPPIAHSTQWSQTEENLFLSN